WPSKWPAKGKSACDAFGFVTDPGRIKQGQTINRFPLPATRQGFFFRNASEEALIPHTFINAMRTSSLLLALVATSLGVAQERQSKPLVIRVYEGNDFRSYCLDPPRWVYLPKGFRRSKSAHWLYRNHRYIFLDIKLN